MGDWRTELEKAYRAFGITEIPVPSEVKQLTEVRQPISVKETHYVKSNKKGVNPKPIFKQNGLWVKSPDMGQDEKLGRLKSAYDLREALVKELKFVEGKKDLPNSEIQSYYDRFTELLDEIRETLKPIKGIQTNQFYIGLKNTEILINIWHKEVTKVLKPISSSPSKPKLLPAKSNYPKPNSSKFINDYVNSLTEMESFVKRLNNISQTTKEEILIKEKELFNLNSVFKQAKSILLQAKPSYVRRNKVFIERYDAVFNSFNLWKYTVLTESPKLPKTSDSEPLISPAIRPIDSLLVPWKSVKFLNKSIEIRFKSNLYILPDLRVFSSLNLLKVSFDESDCIRAFVNEATMLPNGKFDLSVLDKIFTWMNIEKEIQNYDLGLKKTFDDFQSIL